MNNYDPDKAPDPAEWLALEEAEQFNLVAAYHGLAGGKAPHEYLHAMVHVVVENQLAEEITVARDALERLTGEGLGRHDAIHAMGDVLIDHMRGLARESATGQGPLDLYLKDLRSLTMATWKERQGRKKD
ncbi:MAG: hypothetical protein LDL33_07225 [Desulfomonile sp.]|nr:hypothetical protein [Desulfomonile sp.]